METIKTLPAINWTQADKSNDSKITLWNKFLAYCDSQKEKRTLWFFVSLTVHGVFILPLPLVLIYYFNAPALILLVTMCCFFGNFIANMGGAGIRVTLSFFAASVLIHLAMLLVFVI